MWRRTRAVSLLALLALTVLVVAHNLVFLLAYGSDYRLALQQTGHGTRWDDTVRVVLIATALLVATATVRVAQLHLQLRALRPGFGPDAENRRLEVRPYVRSLLWIWVALFSAALLLFLVQENIERLSAGPNLPGLRVLFSADPVGPIPVFGVVSLFVAAVAALFRWGITVLEARVAAARLSACHPAHQARLIGRTDPVRPRPSILGRNLAGRAPPAPLPA